MPHVQTLILTAVTAELAPIVKRLGLRRGRGAIYGDHTVSAATLGVGSGRAAASGERLLARLCPQRVIVTGTAGAADPELKTGDLCTPTDVLDLNTGERFSPELIAGARGTLGTAAAIIGTPAEKARLFAERGVTAIDMETASIARLCAAQRVPWFAVRAILDTADETLPSGLERLTRPDGSVHGPNAAILVLTQPWRIPSLMRLARQTHEAMANVADMIAHAL